MLLSWDRMGSHVDNTRDVKDLFHTTWVAGVSDVLRKQRGGVVSNGSAGRRLMDLLIW